LQGDVSKKIEFICSEYIKFKNISFCFMQKLILIG